LQSTATVQYADAPGKSRCGRERSLKPNGLAFSLIGLGLALSARPLPGQTISYFRQFTTPAMDRAIAVAADASGIYVIGIRPTPGGLISTGMRKYDSRGNELLTRELSASASLNVRAAANATGVYVVSGEPCLLRRYSAEANELWTRELGFPGLCGVAADATGVYVSGRDSFPDFTSYLRKYSPDGAELWTTRFGDRNNLDNVFGLAVDTTGVYAVGLAARYGPVTQQFSFVRKYDSRGNELWTRLLDSQLNPGIGTATNADGVFVVSGYTGPDAEGGFSLRKFDNTGNVIWTRPVATSSRLYPSAVTADATGVYVVGTTRVAGPSAPLTTLPGQCRSGSGGDSFVRKYDLDGAEVWTREFGSSQATWASGITVDADGVYVVGEEGTAQVRDDLELFNVFAPANPGSAAFLAKIDKAAAAPAGSGPRIFPDCVVNAASYVGGGVAPGEIVALFGSAMGPAELVRLRLTEDRTLATALADSRILFNGMPAPLLYVSDKQSSAIVPYAVAGRPSVDVQVEYRGVRSDPVAVPVLASRPGIFSLNSTGQGQGAILNEDGTVNSPSNPALRGSIITIFATGGGEAAPGVVDGEIVSGVLPRTTLPVSVFFPRGPYEEWAQGEVLYAGGSSGSVAGLLQVNVRMPLTSGAGHELPFALIIGSHWTVSQVTIAVR
jgi:uncharacterized protein (TIGR03437 family)